MPTYDNKVEHLEECSCEDLLEELRERERESKAAGMPKTVRPLSEFGTKALVGALKASQKLVYGVDDRQELFSVTDSDVLRSADSVVSLIDVGNISDNGNGTSNIRTVPFSSAQGLCSTERFGSQPTAPFCSGFLVARDIVATAGHCIDTNTLARTRFVFGFRMVDESTAQVTIPNDAIFRGTGIIGRKLENTGSDFAVVRLDRPATGRPVAEIRRSGKVDDGAMVYVIGHPSGLPLKYAPGAVVRDNSPGSFFVANLDTYGGNSGSPVFEEDSDIVEGILVRGDTDFVSNGTCIVSNVCPTTGCRGEDVTRAAEFKDFVPSPSVAEPVDLETRVANVERNVEEIADTVKEIKAKLEE